jgi:hypothetical protein
MRNYCSFAVYAGAATLQAHLPLQIRNKARLDGPWQACIPSQTCAIRRSLSFGRYQLNPSRLAAGTRMPACHSTRQVRIMPCLECARRAQPFACGRNLLPHQLVCYELRFQRPHLFKFMSPAEKLFTGIRPPHYFCCACPRLGWPREESLVAALSIVLRRCNSFHHEVFRVCTHPEANIVCRRTSLGIFRQLARTSWAARLR